MARARLWSSARSLPLGTRVLSLVFLLFAPTVHASLWAASQSVPVPAVIVPVEKIADGLGTLSLKDEDLKRLRAAGVKFHRFNKPHFFHLHRVNFRDHRKLMIVDGYVGFTGNASPNAPHLHFAIARSADVKRWSRGKAVDPLPLLVASIRR